LNDTQVIKCRAAVLWKEGQPLTIENITVDPPKAGEIRVRNVSAGICASDAHFVWNMDTDLKLDFGGNPVVLGHEGSAVVESVGDGVKGVEIGDSIIPLFMPNCGKCELCDNPKTNLCCDANFETTLYHSDGETRLKINGKPLLTLAGTSTYSEYSVLRESQICKVIELTFNF
jgi:S-(hydroxymethyl)glutathione dehydrogenase/alcohol dehydrogenase